MKKSLLYCWVFIISGVFRGGGKGGGALPRRFFGGARFLESCLKEKSLKGQIFVQRIHQYWIYYSNYIVLYVYYFFIMKKFEKKCIFRCPRFVESNFGGFSVV